MPTKDVASRVLDYWFALEFLGQDSYDSITNESMLTRDLTKFKKAGQEEKNRRKQITVFESVNEDLDLYSQIKKQADSCGMTTWGNITFYIGRVKRQVCIEKIAYALGRHLDQAEINYSDYIPVLSFQCTYRGDYVERSLSLSTIIWSLSQLSRKSTNISDLLSDLKYATDVEILERTIFRTEMPEDEDITSPTIDTLNQGSMPVFNDTSITTKDVLSVHEKLLGSFGQFVGGNNIEYKICIKYQLFKDEKSKIKYDDDNYMGLSHDFFSKDIKMVQDAICGGSFDTDKGILRDLVTYICAPNERQEKRERFDLLKPADKNIYISRISELLDIANAPLGKWPSRYMPALMQQVAVNLARPNSNTSKKVGKIFSVNGPPGTGKTALLKEIIASNVVEKAKLLSQYEQPDSAFQGVWIEQSETLGASAKYLPKWYRFIDDRVTDYGVLVTSCNNAAVENITKELPLEKGILDSLEVRKDDSVGMQGRINDIRQVFSVENTDRTISAYKKDNIRQGDYPEIYFTAYAQNLLGVNSEKSGAWGLVTVPLGKKSNISGFYYDVLLPLCQDFYTNNSTIEQHLPNYKKARNEFLKQLRRVEKLRDDLKRYGDVTLKAHTALVTYKGVETRNTELIQDNQKHICNYVQLIEKKQTELALEADKLNNANNQIATIEARIQEYEKQKADLSNQDHDYKRQALAAEESVTIFTKIFRKSKYDTALNLAMSYRSKAQECQKSVVEIDAKILNVSAVRELAKNEQVKVSSHVSQLETERSELQESLQKCQEVSTKLSDEIILCRSTYEEAKDIYLDTLSRVEKNGELQKMTILDRDFVDNLFSEDVNMVTQLHLSNPWTTEEYNKEREQLFYLSLQLTKEFLLSSKSCRSNLNLLGLYWGFGSISGTDKAYIHNEDKEEMIGALLNTLFLLSPAISSTFASIGRLLRDIKRPGVIGTLIIDEAGQAQPQMAVGALYRARRAIIVGDPKQVEPVVTDDLKLLKDAFSEKVFANYKDKSLSVQSCADIVNPLGTYYENGTDYPDWVGCPLVIHRRCISPMYEISNRICYQDNMKQQTLPPSDLIEEKFIFRHSQWINVSGNEIGYGNHYVTEQGKQVCEMVEKAFSHSEYPDLYVISPFKTIVEGIRSQLGIFAHSNRNSAISKSCRFTDWLYSNIGTIHTFQGKETSEVIFVLGCDVNQSDRYAVKSFVNSNVVNVAVTRAKYRLYIIGDFRVWKNNLYIREAKSIMDTLPVEKIAAINHWEDSSEKNEALIIQASQLPGAQSFVAEVGSGEKGEPIFELDADSFASYIDAKNFINKNLSPEQFQQFGFQTKEEFEALPTDVKKNLLMGMKLYYLLQPIYEISADFDASCCGILFCKGMELQLRKNFSRGLRTSFPNFKIKNTANQDIHLKNAAERDIMMGTVQFVLRNNMSEINKILMSKGQREYASEWWNSFLDKLRCFGHERNMCCHSQLLTWADMEKLLDYEFREDANDVERSPRIGGVFFESEKGKLLEA